VMSGFAGQGPQQHLTPVLNGRMARSPLEAP
jgi:hypothetical protein